MMLFDISPSTEAPEVRQLYMDSFDTVMATAGDGWQVAADLVDSDPLAHSSFPLNECIPVFRSEVDPLTHEEQVQKIREDAKTAVEGLLNPSAAPDRGTAILDGLALAQRFFESYPEAKSRYLVLFSDMVETESYELKPANLEPEAVSTFIEEQRAAGDLPNLSRVEVYVVGAGATAGGGVDSDRFQAIQDFWLSFVQATGANFRLPATDALSSGSRDHPETLNLRELLGPILILAFLIFLYWLATRGAFSWAAPNFRIRSVRGEGMTLILAILTLAHFLLDLGRRVGPNPGLLAVLSLAGALLLLGLVSRSGLVPAILGGLGTLVFLYDVVQEDGAATGGYFIVLAVALVLVAALVRSRSED